MMRLPGYNGTCRNMGWPCVSQSHHVAQSPCSPVPGLGFRIGFAHNKTDTSDRIQWNW